MNEDYAYLFKNPWCPLFGDLGDIAQIDDLEERFQVGRCIDIINQARKIWGMTPHDTTFTNWPKEKDISIYKTNFSTFVNEDPDEFYKYPFWKVEEARKIAVIWVHLPQHLAKRCNTCLDRPQDTEWEKTLDIIKDWDTPEINEKITDSEILAVIAIKDAWYALEDIFYYGENEDSPGVFKKVQVASGLLTKAQQLETEKIIKDKDQILKNKEADTEKKDIMIDALLQKASEEIAGSEGGQTVEHGSEDKCSIEIDSTRKLLKFNAKETRVEPKQIELFELLWENKDNPVERKLIDKTLWPETDDKEPVSPIQIEQQINKLKDGLEKLGFKRKIITTHRKTQLNKGAYEIHSNLSGFLKKS